MFWYRLRQQIDDSLSVTTKKGFFDKNLALIDCRTCRKKTSNEFDKKVLYFYFISNPWI